MTSHGVDNSISSSKYGISSKLFYYQDGEVRCYRGFDCTSNGCDYRHRRILSIDNLGYISSLGYLQLSKVFLQYMGLSMLIHLIEIHPTAHRQPTGSPLHHVLRA